MSARLRTRAASNRTIAALVATIALLPASALACPVCQDPRDPNQGAFLSMTIFMSLLPLALIGGVVAYVWRMVHAGETEGSTPEGRPESNRS